MSRIIRPSSAPLYELYRQDLASFAERAFYELNPGEKFLWSWHIELVVSKLEAFLRGEIRRLIINLPPRHLKSHLVSIAFPCFWLGHRPSAKIISVSYGQEFSDFLSRNRRALINSPVYQSTFGTRLGVQTLGEIRTTQGGSCMATSLGGVLMGRGADAIVIDDPLKPDDALSQVVRVGANGWYLNSLLSRLNSQVTGQILLVMQRLHEDDLAGFLQAQGGFEILSLPAIAECNEVHHIVRPFGTLNHIRRDGEALHPELLPLEKLRDMEQKIGSYNFAGQYQQRPAPFGGGIINIDWFTRYGQKERPKKFDLVLQSWDCANKVSEEASYSVCITFGVTPEKIYILHVLRKRLEFPDLKRAVREQAKAHGANVVLIEDKAAGTQLIQEMVREGLDCAKGAEPTTDKRSRMLAQTPAIENGRILLPAEAHWLGDFLSELALFPNGKHDDQADALSQGLRWIADNGIEPGLLTYYKNELRDALAAMQKRNAGR